MSFDLKKYLAKNPLTEDFPKNKWVYLTDEEKEEFAIELFDLIDNAYASIGGHPNYKSPSDVMGAERDSDYMVIDLDDDPEFDAVVVDKSKASGVKGAAMGHDGSREARSLAVNFLAIMLKNKGHYIEVSGKLKDILIAKGVPVVTDKETIQQVMKGKNIEMNDDGTYQRMLGGEKHTKTMMGNPL
mgnify:CR=1 FL=1